MDVDVNQERFLPLRPIETVASNVSVTFVALKMCNFFFVTVCEIACLKI